MEKQFNLIIDTKRTGFNAVRGFKQEENNSVLYINLVQNSIPFDLTGLTVRINFKRSDGQVLLQMADITSFIEGKIKVNILTRVLKLLGEVKADLSIFNKENEKITSASFSMFVDAPIYTNDYILGNDEFDIIQRVWTSEDERIKAENTRKLNETNRIENESIREKNEKDRTEKEHLRQVIEDQRQDNEAGREKSEATRIENEKTRETNESKRIENEENRVTQESKRIEAEEERKINETARINNEKQRLEKEEERKLNEKQRVENEDVRKSNENSRIQEENKRLDSENIRKDNEITRQNNEIVRESNENKRQDSENTRITQENDRAKEWDLIKDSYLENNMGDMKKLTYDRNNNGIVDVAESITDGSITYTATDIKDIIDNSNNIERKTYEELTQLIEESKLVTGGIYLLTDYQTKYKIPQTSEWCVGETEELYLTATSTNTLSPQAYSKQYPQDIIYYDVTLNETEGQQRTGFIIRRIDIKNNNSAPFDFRTAQWARFKLSPTSYEFKGNKIPYDTYTAGEEVEEGRVYKQGTSLYLATKTGTPESIGDINYIVPLITEAWIYFAHTNGLYVYGSTTRLIPDEAYMELLPTFSADSTNNNIEGFNHLSNCVFVESHWNTLGLPTVRNTFRKANFNTLDNTCSDNLITEGSRNVLHQVVSRCFIHNNCMYNTIETSTANVHMNRSCTNNTIGNSGSNNSLLYQCTHITIGSGSLGNIFNINCSRITIGSNSSVNKFGTRCTDITLGDSCVRNTFGLQCSQVVLGNACTNNVFGDVCSDIQFYSSCASNTIHDSCHNIRFASKCNNNQIFNYCQFITFGGECTANILNNECMYITLGNLCKRDEFDSQCARITFLNTCNNNKLGSNCTDISFGNRCSDNTITSPASQITFSDYCINNTFGSNANVVNVLGCLINCKFGINFHKATIHFLEEKDLTAISALNGSSFDITIQKITNAQYVYSYINKSMGYETVINPIP